MTAANPTAIRANAIYRLVRLLLHWSRYAEAEEILAGAVETFPRTPRFHIQRGVAQMGLVRFANAMESFTAALRLDPGQYRREALAGLSQVYRAIGESDKARALLDKAGITAADTTGLLDIKPAAAACA
jgi:tetratricopeptide (TPR) repeat protein